jgi:hypothetical protein
VVLQEHLVHQELAEAQVVQEQVEQQQSTAM